MVRALTKYWRTDAYRFLLRVFLSVLDWSAFAVMMLSCGVTIICMHYKWCVVSLDSSNAHGVRFTDMPLSLLASGIIFPISFRYAQHPQ